MAPVDLIAHHREGTGSPLVLLHGIAASWECWAPVLPLLSARHDVIAVDLPGFGDSIGLVDDRPSLRAMAERVLELLDELGIDRFHVCGNSMGGGVGIALADLAPARVLSYTGISSAGQTYGRAVHATRTLLRGSYYGARLVRPIAGRLMQSAVMRRVALWQMVGRPSRLTADYATDLVVHCAEGSGFRLTLRFALKNEPLDAPDWDGPAQMIWGTRDLILPISALERWTRVWPGLEPVRMPGLGHVPMSDDPELVAGHITSLTTRVDAGT